MEREKMLTKIITFSNYNLCLLLLVCVITQFCAISCNNTNDKHLFERRINGRLNVGKSGSTNPFVENKIHFNNQLKDRSSQQNYLNELSSIASRVSLPQQNPMLYNRNPINPINQNPFQNLFDGSLNDGLVVSHVIDSMDVPNSNKMSANVIKNYLKKYDLKKYFLKKILGDSYESEEGHDDGFFGNKHLRRHGAAGMAAKVFGELIGIKIRETIEDYGKSLSNYAKEFTTSGVVSLGNTFSKLFRVA